MSHLGQLVLETVTGGVSDTYRKKKPSHAAREASLLTLLALVRIHVLGCPGGLPKRRSRQRLLHQHYQRRCYLSPLSRSRQKDSQSVGTG